MKKILLSVIFTLSICSCFIVNANAEEWLWPLNGHYHITSAFGWRISNGESDYHGAIDINDSSIAYAPVYASKSGDVTYKWVDGAGYCVYIKHSDGYQTRYAHLASYVSDKPSLFNKDS